MSHEAPNLPLLTAAIFSALVVCALAFASNPGGLFASPSGDEAKAAFSRPEAEAAARAAAQDELARTIGIDEPLRTPNGSDGAIPGLGCAIARRPSMTSSSPTSDSSSGASAARFGLPVGSSTVPVSGGDGIGVAEADVLIEDGTGKLLSSSVGRYDPDSVAVDMPTLDTSKLTRVCKDVTPVIHGDVPGAPKTAQLCSLVAPDSSAHRADPGHVERADGGAGGRPVSSSNN